ncbi:MAG: ArsC family reductase [Nitrococcus mobilis]|nr:ArsC family reductase [Nitrococcus mobilis]
MFTLYGLKNCDTCRKARRWLDANGADYRFRDVRDEGVTEAKLRAWAEQVGWEVLLNRRGSTWRRLPDAEQAIDSAAALALMARYPVLIKRPVLEAGERVLVGFREAEYQALL